ncbi:MAG: LytTR family transcriptional regulator [Candidatus Nomurabacteria bacterium]|jgi:DNA-binding LytR/AlgR family response regulator|nr:LytTR family transcriptional regulator [Candidatus Nomurabacteria bacterium]
MKIRIETDKNLREPEIIIRTRGLDGDSAQLQSAIVNALAKTRRLTLTRGGKEFYLPPDDVLFFESVDGRTFAHTASQIFESKQRLYELEDSLPSSFARISKSVIANTRRILAVTRNLTGPSLIQFRGSHKQISVSRSYFKMLRDKLNERSLYEKSNK